jgi:hypothetical protein
MVLVSFCSDMANIACESKSKRPRMSAKSVLFVKVYMRA